MFSINQLTGALLPPKTLCLTFDDGPWQIDGDGPGPKTVRLAKYLNQENIRAAFFVLGRHAKVHPAIMGKLVSLGHIIGNHTVNHPDFCGLPSFVEAIAEMDEAHKTIVHYNHHNTLYFRAPYGGWPEGFASDINSHWPEAKSYIGPIAWDMNENDWDFWGNLSSARACADAYLAAITQLGKGIVVMHDCTAEQDALGLLRRDNNRTFETIQILVPVLKGMGYTFVGLDEIVF